MPKQTDKLKVVKKTTLELDKGQWSAHFNVHEMKGRVYCNINGGDAHPTNFSIESQTQLRHTYDLLKAIIEEIDGLS